MDNEEIVNTHEEVTLETSDSVEEKPIIKLENIDIYHRKILILSKTSIDIKKGEFVYLIGRTGSGKSSLLKALFADFKVKGDKARIYDFDLLKLKNRQIPKLRKKLGIIFQDYQLLTDRSIYDNLIFTMKATGWKDKKLMKDRAKEILEKVELWTKDFKFPHQLSGGEQQRACIARALINNPDIILADEPTGNLDPITAEEIFKLLMTLNQENGTTILLATHNFPMIDKFPSRTLCIEDNHVIDSGI